MTVPVSAVAARSSIAAMKSSLHGRKRRFETVFRELVALRRSPWSRSWEWTSHIIIATRHNILWDMTKRNPVAGFYAGRTHSIIPNTDCAIQHPCNHMILETILAFMKQYDVPAYEEKSIPGWFVIFSPEWENIPEIMVCLIINEISCHIRG